MTLEEAVKEANANLVADQGITLLDSMRHDYSTKTTEARKILATLLGLVA